MTTLVKPSISRGVKRSTNARRVAEKVIEQVSKGEKIVLAKAIKAVGYTDSMARHPNKVTNQPEYKETVETYVESLKKLRDKTLKALHSKDLPTEKVFDLTQLLKQTTHDTQLLEGKATEHIATKAEIVVFGSDDFLKRQLEANKSNGSV